MQIEIENSKNTTEPRLPPRFDSACANSCLNMDEYTYHASNFGSRNTAKATNKFKHFVAESVEV